MNGFFNAEAQRRRGRKDFSCCRNLKFWRLVPYSHNCLISQSLRLCASALIILGAGIALAADAQERVPPAPLSLVGDEAVKIEDAARAAAKGGYAIRDAESAERALREAGVLIAENTQHIVDLCLELRESGKL